MKVWRAAHSHPGPRGRRSIWLGDLVALEIRARHRRGYGLLRCQLPRVGEPAEAHLGLYRPCAALVFESLRAQHLADVHDVTLPAAALVASAFTPVE